jgi:hypothetical protein
LAEALPWCPYPARATDVPNSGELRLPTGGARFTVLKRLRADTENVRE